MRAPGRLWWRVIIVGAVLVVLYVGAGLGSLEIVNAPLYEVPPGMRPQDLDPRMHFTSWAYYSTNSSWNAAGYYFFWPVHKALFAVLPGTEKCGFIIDDDEWLEEVRGSEERRRQTGPSSGVPTTRSSQPSSYFAGERNR